MTDGLMNEHFANLDRRECERVKKLENDLASEVAKRQEAEAGAAALREALLVFGPPRQFADSPCFCNNIDKTYCVGFDQCKEAQRALSAEAGRAFLAEHNTLRGEVASERVLREAIKEVKGHFADEQAHRGAVEKENVALRAELRSFQAAAQERWDMLRAENERLRELLPRLRRTHNGIGRGCPIRFPRAEEDICDCGADAHNALIDAALKEGAGR